MLFDAMLCHAMRDILAHIDIIACMRVASDCHRDIVVCMSVVSDRRARVVGGDSVFDEPSMIWLKRLN